MKETTITIFTDGSARGNPGPGGWGAVVISPNGKVAELGGREEHTTNNRMEIAAALSALAFIESRKIVGDTIEINTDSAYLLQGVTGWMYGWEKNNWKTKTGDDVLNQDLWKELGAIVFRLKQKRTLDWKKVGGHIGLLGNERADAIATNAADRTQQILFVGALADYEKIIGGTVFAFDETAPAKKLTKQKSSQPAFSYLSMIGGVIAIHKTWSECEARVKGKRGAKFKKVFSEDEEEQLKKQWMENARG